MSRPLGAGALLAVVALCACTIESRTDRIVEEAEDSSSLFIRPWPGAAPAAVRSGDLVWIWGITGIVPQSSPPRLVDGGIVAETRQALTNLLDLLELAGAQARDVAQCSVFVADNADLAPMREVYTEFFTTPPRRAAVVAAGLAMGALVEIECTAVVPTAP